MAVTESDLRKSVGLLRELGARKVVLFGSALTAPDSAADLDLACEGVPAERFFYAAGRLLQLLGKPVDLVDLSQRSPFTEYVTRHGQVLYDCR